MSHPIIEPDADGEQEFSVAPDALRSFLETEDGAAWAKQVFAEAQDRGFARRQKHAEARQGAFTSFLQYLDQLPAGHQLPEGFHQRWQKWLLRIGREEKAKLPLTDRTNDRRGKWLKTAWMTTELNDPVELQTGRFIYHDKEPAGDKHPALVILIHQNGQWIMPEKQKLAATVHPFVRAFCNTLPSLPDKSAVLGKMRWALTLDGEQQTPEAMLGNAARYLRVALYGDIRECLPVELERCLPFEQLPDTAPLWKLLNAAVGFGRMLQHQETFGDGSVEATLQKGLRSDIGLTPRQLIARWMDEYFNERGSEATSMRLLEWLGATRPGSNGDFIIFPTDRRDGLPNLSWECFDQTVKNEKRSRLRQV